MNILLLLVTLSVVSAHINFNLRLQSNDKLDSYWEDFKRIYGKKYGRQFEIIRRLIWESNLEYIQRHNLEYDLGEHSYSLGMNQFGDLTHKEFKATHLTMKPTLRNESCAVFMTPLNMNNFPDSVDWRKEGYVTEVKDQGQCGSSWSFSVVGAMEGQYFRRNGRLVNLSAQQLIDCSTDFGNQGCGGGTMEQAFLYLRYLGIETDEEYPYTARDEECKFSSEKIFTKVACSVGLPPQEKYLFEAVATVGPVSVGVDASRPSFQFYKDGVYNEPRCSSKNVNHGLLTVGYGSQNSKDYWIVKNSWGQSWGQDGYIWMSRNKHNQCGIATTAEYPTL